MDFWAPRCSFGTHLHWYTYFSTKKLSFDIVCIGREDHSNKEHATCSFSHKFLWDISGTFFSNLLRGKEYACFRVVKNMHVTMANSCINTGKCVLVVLLLAWAMASLSIEGQEHVEILTFSLFPRT